MRTFVTDVHIYKGAQTQTITGDAGLRSTKKLFIVYTEDKGIRKLAVGLFPIRRDGLRFIVYLRGIKMKLLRNFLAVLLLGSAGIANATTYDLGNIGSSTTGTWSSATFQATSFTDTLSFTLSSAATFSGTLTDNGIKFTSVLLGDRLLFSSSTATSAPFTTGLLTAGAYTLSFSGNKSGAALKQYNLGWSTVAAVPEPEEWAMLLAGLGLVGFKLRRKEKDFNLQCSVLNLG